MDVIHNERVKLSANAVNTAATSSFTVGVLAPLAAALYGAPVFGSRAIFIVITAIAWISLAVTLHRGARRILRGLQP